MGTSSLINLKSKQSYHLSKSYSTSKLKSFSHQQFLNLLKLKQFDGNHDQQNYKELKQLARDLYVRRFLIFPTINFQYVVEQSLNLLVYLLSLKIQGGKS